MGGSGEGDWNSLPEIACVFECFDTAHESCEKS